MRTTAKNAETHAWLMVRGRNGRRRIERLGWKRLAGIYYAARPGSAVRKAINAEARRCGYTPRTVIALHAEQEETAMEKRERPKMYDAKVAGRKVRVTVPDRHETVAYSGDAAEVMRDVLRDNLSPRAVATIAAYLQPVRTMDPAILRQVTWFRELLTTVVGGDDELNRLCDEAGL